MRKFNYNTPLGVALIVTLVVVVGLGWVMNFQNLLEYALWSKELVISPIGIFFPFHIVISGWVY